MVKDVQEYIWSSGRSHIFGEPNQILVGGNWFDEKERGSYIEFVNKRDKKEEEVIRRNTRVGRPLGGDDFLDKMEGLLSRCLRPKKGGRPWKK